MFDWPVGKAQDMTGPSYQRGTLIGKIVIPIIDRGNCRRPVIGGMRQDFGHHEAANAIALAG
jgi:hypothetical protein